jgi:hypothetical protein
MKEITTIPTWGRIRETMKKNTIFVIAALMMLAVIAMPVNAAGNETQDFVGENTAGYAPLTVTFISTSKVTNVTDYQWGYVRVQPPASGWTSFSPGERNTTFTFTNTGSYYIMMTEFTPDYPKGYISTTKANFVTVLSQATPTPTPTPTATPTPAITPTPTPTPIPQVKQEGIGVFRPATGVWYLDMDRNGVSDITVRFGIKDDVPMPADYNGDGITDICVFRPSTGYWYFDYNMDGRVDKSFRYGTIGDIPLNGKWV